MLLSALRRARAAGQEPAVVYSEIGVHDRSVLKGPGAKSAAFQQAAAAHELRPKRGVQPGQRGKIESVAKDKALARTLPDVGDQETGLPHFFLVPDIGQSSRKGFIF